jgi:hypothetical protein
MSTKTTTASTTAGWRRRGGEVEKEERLVREWAAHGASVKEALVSQINLKGSF